MPDRRTGASRAAAHGAVAALVLFVGPIGYRTVHTGNMTYAGNAPRIPVAAIAAEDADKLQRIQDRGESVEVNLSLGRRDASRCGIRERRCRTARDGEA